MNFHLIKTFSCLNLRLNFVLFDKIIIELSVYMLIVGKTLGEISLSIHMVMVYVLILRMIRIYVILFLIVNLHILGLRSIFIHYSIRNKNVKIKNVRSISVHLYTLMMRSLRMNNIMISICILVIELCLDFILMLRVYLII